MDTITNGETTWITNCKVCKADNASAISQLCKACWNKVYYQKNKVTILQKAQLKSQEPEQKAKRAALNKAWLDRPANKEKKRLQQLAHARKPGARFTRSKLRAKNKSLDWSLSKQTYFALIQMECFYCNGFFQKQTDMTGIGLDRIDNTKGYVPGNIISSCGACNLLRQDRWSVEQTKVMVQAVIEYNKLNHLPAPSATIESEPDDSTQ